VRKSPRPSTKSNSVLKIAGALTAGGKPLKSLERGIGVYLLKMIRAKIVSRNMCPVDTGSPEISIFCRGKKRRRGDQRRPEKGVGKFRHSKLKETPM